MTLPIVFYSCVQIFFLFIKIFLELHCRVLVSSVLCVGVAVAARAGAGAGLERMLRHRRRADKLPAAAPALYGAPAPRQEPVDLHNKVRRCQQQQQQPPHHCVPGAGVLRGRVRLPARAVGGAGGPGVRHHLRQEVRLEEGGENINTPDCEKFAR